MAAAILIVAPALVFFLLTQLQFIEGMVSGSVNGLTATEPAKAKPAASAGSWSTSPLTTSSIAFPDEG